VAPNGTESQLSGLKIRRPQGRGGSSPPLGTIKTKDLMVKQATATVACFLVRPAGRIHLGVQIPYTPGKGKC
jgi:hypothetical protein